MVSSLPMVGTLGSQRFPSSDRRASWAKENRLSLNVGQSKKMDSTLEYRGNTALQTTLFYSNKVEFVLIASRIILLSATNYRGIYSHNHRKLIHHTLECRVLQLNILLLSSDFEINSTNHTKSTRILETTLLDTELVHSPSLPFLVLPRELGWTSSSSCITSLWLKHMISTFERAPLCC